MLVSALVGDTYWAQRIVLRPNPTLHVLRLAATDGLPNVVWQECFDLGRF